MIVIAVRVIGNLLFYVNQSADCCGFADTYTYTTPARQRGLFAATRAYPRFRGY